MIIVYALLGISILTIIFAIVSAIFNIRSKRIYSLIAIGVLLSVVLLFFALISMVNLRVETSNLRENFAVLSLYYSPVSQSKDEYVRYDYYTRISDFNEELEHHQRRTTSPLTNAFYPKDWDDGLVPISFELNGISY